MRDFLINYLINTYSSIPTSVFVGIGVLFLLGSVLFMAFPGLQKGVKWIVGLLLLEYLLVLVFSAVVLRTVQETREFNFSPFWSYHFIRGGNNLLFTQAIMNVLAFIPVGFLFGCTFGKMKWWKVLLFGAAFSLMIETLQFVLKRGFAEFDDVFHNIAGCLIGYAAYVSFIYVKRGICDSHLCKRISN